MCWTVICLIYKTSFNTFYNLWFLTPGSNLLFMTTLKQATSETCVSKRFQVTGKDRHKPKKICRPTQHFNMSHCATCFVSREPSSGQTVVVLRAVTVRVSEIGSAYWDRIIPPPMHTQAHTHSRHADSGSWVVNSQRLFRSAFNAPAVLDSKICLHFCHFLSSLHFGEHSLPLSQNRPSPPTHTLTALRFYSHIIGFFR